MNVRFHHDEAKQLNGEELIKLELPVLIAHYRHVAADKIRFLSRHKRQITLFVVAGFGLAVLLIQFLPRTYIAEALVRPDFSARDEGAKSTQIASIDGTSVIGSEAVFMRSDAMLRKVAKRLGYKDDRSTVRKIVGKLLSALSPELRVNDPLHRAVRRLRAQLDVSSQPRTYLISVSASGSSPEEAAKVANAVALEYARSKKLQRLSDSISHASRELAQKSAIYGEKHPIIANAEAQLNAARAQLQSETVGDSANSVETVVGDGVVLAEPNPMPSGPKGWAILGIAFVASFSFGIAAATWRDKSMAA